MNSRRSDNYEGISVISEAEAELADQSILFAIQNGMTNDMKTQEKLNELHEGFIDLIEKIKCIRATPWGG